MKSKTRNSDRDVRSRAVAIASLADRETQLREGRIERDGMLETDTEMGRMKLEFTRVTQDKMLELERRSGFHY